MTKHDTPQQARKTASSNSVNYVLHIELLDNTTTYIACKIDHHGLNRTNLSRVGICRALSTVYNIGQEHRDAKAAANAKLIVDNIPGYTELAEAYRARTIDYDRYFGSMQKMMDDESNDGVCPPDSLDINHDDIVKKLEIKYPKAKMYIKNINADPSTSTGYGRLQAADAILNGASIESAQNIIDNAVTLATAL
ncbi:MAG: hypothetical protein JRJ39_00115 [Deltaproteobacteria bacterium]|nr:hypothetical protein [Deltaproteobacteria bacterium]